MEPTGSHREFVVRLPNDDGPADPDALARNIIYATGLYGGQVHVRDADGDPDAWAAPETWETWS